MEDTGGWYRKNKGGNSREKNVGWRKMVAKNTCVKVKKMYIGLGFALLGRMINRK
ncbi:hypothetical protein SFV1gp66 [Sulfolobus filamentous virus 1]|uniref:Uncharacterized protein n=2 Tax=Alphalipothrixvirus beppuense TaxID=2734584 RepID=A0A346LU40_SUFV1|nr:hypothetical protein HOT91_gp01 [Sulfolobus filamentous virus 1]YP_009808176.1 hypothetical protein HOT91_gp66 [Sulfolobus filamentous virus 1]AXQ00083.1 hypothetical protein SFV1gp01 [Sulfolobus filamentous virus 1]AXQ00148.1 hypothetical protein SFV1gp66 [Sulfolobus filamentous virus 1]AZI75702.1 hypothetical protein SBFV1_gp01 [Sulfolobales Beppu filamentous phage 1]